MFNPIFFGLDHEPLPPAFQRPKNGLDFALEPVSRSKMPDLERELLISNPNFQLRKAENSCVWLAN
jgi:hypothetical protein